MRSVSGLRGRNGESGVVAIVVAIMLVVLMAAVALAVDVGGMYLKRRELVNGADAAALSAARTCARGTDTRFPTGPEAAADYQIQQNQAILASETTLPNITDITQCGTQYGHVSVRYTSQQALHFAPVLGFNYQTPVTTAATASWGLGSVNSVPLILSQQLYGTCPKPPPTGTAAEWNAVPSGQCGIWYDNDTLNNGNFGFLTLDPAGWNVPGGDVTNDCSGSNPGSSTLGDWISGKVQTAVTLNWLDPTYVCSTGGLKGNSNPWVELQKLVGQVRDFPITWEGPQSPGYGAPAQGYVLHSSSILKYDVIGFAAMQINGVYTVQDAGGSSSTTQQPWTDYAYNAAGITLNSQLDSGSVVTYVWNGHTTNGQNPQPIPNTTCTFTTNQPKAAGTFAWSAFSPNGGGCPGNNDAVDAIVSVTITHPVTTTTYGPCGPPPPGSNGNGNSSTRCVVLTWKGSTLTNDYSQPLDNITVVRLCDFTLGNCLDQNPHHP
jgi:Flp pilus assembly protein TadG